MTGTKALSSLRLNLRRKKIDALLVTQPENRRYLSGYTGHEASIAETAGVLLLPAEGEPYLLTDSRYHLQAEREARGFRVILYPRGLFALLRRLLRKLSIKRLAFESHYVLHDTAISLEKMGEKIGVEFVPVTDMIEPLRLIKTEDEIGRIRRAVLLNEEVFQTVFHELRPGMTERGIAQRIETLMREKGAESPSFPAIVAGGPNAALPHAIPTDRKVRQGETLIIDMGLVLDGYCSDMTRTVVLGPMDDWTKILFRIVRKAQLTGIRMLKAGITGFDVDKTAREVINKAGLGDRFGHGLGHGVGLAVHEGPSLSWRNRKKLRSGMVVTVEPGVYIPDWGGIRLENMAVVRHDGCEILNCDTTFLDV